MTTHSDEERHLWRLVEERASRGDRIATNILGSLYVDRALQELDASLLEVAEEQFLRAAILGNESASAFVKTTWPQLRAQYAADIARKKHAAD
jgi:hypothetical protein